MVVRCFIVWIYHNIFSLPSWWIFRLRQSAAFTVLQWITLLCIACMCRGIRMMNYLNWNCWVAGCVCVYVHTQSRLTLCDPTDCRLPGSSVHGIFSAGILEWVAISSSRGSSRPRDWTPISYLASRFFTTEPLGSKWCSYCWTDSRGCPSSRHWSHV